MNVTNMLHKVEAKQREEKQQVHDFIKLQKKQMNFLKKRYTQVFHEKEFNNFLGKSCVFKTKEQFLKKVNEIYNRNFEIDDVESYENPIREEQIFRINNSLEKKPKSKQRKKSFRNFRFGYIYRFLKKEKDNE